MYILNLVDKVARRQESIVNALPTHQAEGKTIQQIKEDLRNEYSIGTIRIDLKILVEKGSVEIDDKRRPAIYWRKRQR